MSVEYFIVLAVCVMLLLALSIISFIFLYQRKVITHQSIIREINAKKEAGMIQAFIQGEEAERMRIAAELHDDVGATLSSIRLFLTQAERSPDPSLIHHSKTILDEGILKIRSISHQLQPRMLQYLGLCKTLESLVDMYARAGAISITFRQDGAVWPEPEHQLALSVYRIVQELINNIVRHAGATAISLTMANRDAGRQVIIGHNGQGLTTAMYQEQLYKKGAIGLKNIENRLKSYGISLIFQAEIENGCSVAIFLPA